MIVHMPFELYSIFVIEERHGFNKQTIGLFFMDKVKMLGLSFIFGVPVLSAILHIIKWGGEWFWLYVWAFLVVFQLFVMTIYPTVIAPLFNKFTPLEEGELRKQIEQLAARVQFPLYKLFVVDGSKRSGHSNAYFYGFFKNKRIVLYDTLLKQMQTPEILAALAHELGHWKMNHVPKLLLIHQFQSLVSLFLFGVFLNWTPMYEAFGFTSKPTMIGLLLFFGFIMSPVDHILGFAMNFLNRSFEFQADAFACKLGHASDLRGGLIKLNTENLSNPNPDKLYSMYHYSHPPLLERLKAISNKKSQ